MKTPKPQKPSLKREKKKAWDAFSKFIRLRDAIETTNTREWVVCCTCGKQYPAFGTGCVQAGHYIPGRNNAILFEEKATHSQCYNCNINLKGNPIKYRKFIEQKYGVEIRDAMEAQAEVSVKLIAQDYIEIRKHYEGRYEGMEKAHAAGGDTAELLMRRDCVVFSGIKEGK